MALVPAASQARLEREAAMKANYRFGLIALASAAIVAAVVSGLKAQTKPPVYVVIEISEIMDADTFSKAVAGAPLVGGRYIMRTQKATALDGGPAPARFVVIAFDTQEKANAWRDSPAIKDVNAVRLRTTKSRSFMVEGLVDH
jgi:uncharacterized protein (DUF1330 family)